MKIFNFIMLLISFCSPALATDLNPNPHIELLSEYLEAACPKGDEIGASYINDKPPLTFDEYNAYFNDEGYFIDTQVRTDGNKNISVSSENTIRGLEELSDIRIENIDNVQYRFEAIHGARRKSVPENKSNFRYQLYVNFISSERVSIWREDCQGFLRVKTITPYVQYDPAVYEYVHYAFYKHVLKPKLSKILRKSQDPNIWVDNWDDAKRVVVMRTCYNNNHPTDDYLDVICTEHNLTYPGGLPDDLWIRRE